MLRTLQALRAGVARPLVTAAAPVRVARVAGPRPRHVSRSAGPAEGGASGTAGDAVVRVPWIAKLLGGAGLIPFVWYAAQYERFGEGGLGDGVVPRGDALLAKWEALTGLDLGWLKSKTQETVRQRFVSYGASILSFMGAVHWGLAMSAPANVPVPRAQYALSVVPSLIGWAACNMGHNSGNRSRDPNVLLAAGFLGVYFYDERLLSKRAIAPWYTFLRTPLTFGVVMACSISAFVAQEKDYVSR